MTLSLIVLLGTAALAVTAIFGQSRARAARRFHAVMEAYAAREIERGMRRDRPRAVRRTFARRRAVRAG
jgi:hypothetical protein